MKDHNLKTVGETLQKILQENNLSNKIDQSVVTTSWEKIAGPLFARHTKRIFMKDAKIYLEINSPALKNELLFLKGDLIKNINAYLGKERVKEVILL